MNKPGEQDAHFRHAKHIIQIVYTLKVFSSKYPSTCLNKLLRTQKQDIYLRINLQKISEAKLFGKRL